MKSILTIFVCLFALTSYGKEKEISLANPRLALVVNSQTATVEFRYALKGQWRKAGEISPVGQFTGPVRTISAALALDRTLTVTYEMRDGKKAELFFTLKNDDPLVEVRPGAGVEKIRVQLKSPYGILPDIRAGDLVFDARNIKEPSIFPPSEHVLLNLIDQGNAIVTLLWPSPRQQVRLAVENNLFTATEVDVPNANPVWIGVAAAAGIWHREDISQLSDLKDKTPAWRVPFPARWSADFPRSNGLTDSYANGVVRNGQCDVRGIHVFNATNRTTWTSARSGFIYPFYTEGQKAGLRVPKFGDHEDITCSPHGSVLVYPLEKSAETPADVYTPLDLMRSAFEHTGLADWDKKIHIPSNPKVMYPTTCASTDKMEKMFDAGEDMTKGQEIVNSVRSMDLFVLSIRERVEEYLVWSKTFQAYCDEQTKIHPELKGMAAEMKDLVTKIDREFAQKRETIKTPADEQALSARIVQLIGSKAPDKVDQVKLLGRQIRTIGGAQDWLVGYFRQILTELRHQAGVRLAVIPGGPQRAFLQEVRDRVFEFTPETFYHEADIESSRR